MKTGKLALILILTATASTSFAADQIHWTVTGQKSVAFDWHSTSATDSKIRYGTSSGDYGNEVTAVHPTPLPSSTGLFWEAKITGLVENTLYYYAIGTGPEHTFQTPPARGNSDFIVHAEGDVGSTADMMSVQALIAGDLPRFVLMLGDLTYGDTGGLTKVDKHFNDVMVWSQDAAYMPAWGNHDWSTSIIDLAQINEYEGRFNFPNSKTSPGAAEVIGNGPGEDWYWFDYGNVRFIAYPEPYSSASRPDWNSKAKTLMDAAQADDDINFIVTFGHIPAYSSGYHNGNSTLKDIMDGLGDGHSKYVLNVNGHSHNYERSFPQHGVVHLTVGTGGGKSLQTVGTCLWLICEQPAWSDFRAMYFGFVQLHFTKTGIQGSFICGPAEPGKNDITCNPGDVADVFTIGKPVADNLVHHWKFDETSGTTAFDSAGTNNAALSNSSWVAGKIGNAASFNGTNTSGNAGKIDFGTGNFTVAHWVKVNDFKDFAGIFNNRSSTSGNTGFHTRTDGTSTIKALIDFGATSKNLAITNAAAGTWYHVAVSVDRAGLMKLYVNGVLAGQTDISAFSATSITNTDSVRLGRDQVSNYFNGVIDDLRIYDSVLSATEIFDLYKQ